jgi:hypothetical protein
MARVKATMNELAITPGGSLRFNFLGFIRD